MLRLFYSHRTEALLERLAAAIAEQRAVRGVWEPVHLVVPNAQVEAYVQQGLAQILGIAAHLKVRFLDGLYRFSLPEQDPPLKLLDRTAYQGTLLALFQEPGFLDAPPLAPVRAYLREERSGVRAVQLSLELARLFEEYTLSRPEWLKAWSRDREPGSGAPQDLEAWQRRLWRVCRERLEATPFHWISLPEYLESGWVERTDFPPAIHLFGLSHVSQTYHQVFRRLAERTELHVYTLNPCEVFWDDLEIERRRPVDALFEEEGEEGSAGDPRALKLWGRPGREHIRLLNAAADYDFEAEFPGLPGETLLQRLQEEIRQRGLPDPEPLGGDESLKILVCPSARREAEAVADRIWETVEAFHARGERLRFSEIAIIVPAAQREACAAQLRAAFDAAHGIPLTELDGPGAALAALVEAAGLLLKLPLTELDRQAVLEVLGHPVLRETRPDLDPGPWADWCEGAGIVRGADASDHAGTYVERDLLSWDQGLARLALGAFLPGEVPLDLGGERYWPGPEAEGGSAFLALARTLVSDVKRLRGLRGDARIWVRALSEFLETHLGSPEETRTRNLQRLLKNLAKLEDLAPEGLAAAELEYAGALELARGALERALTEGSGALARGVVLSSYLPMRAIPFKAIFLMGLGEGLFPGRDPVNPLDLRAFQRRMGDVSPGERDRYLFLEMLLCARERLVLSYVARDPVTGEGLEPSPLLRDLAGIAEAHLEETARTGLRVMVPVHRHEDLSSRAPGARLEAWAANALALSAEARSALLPALEMPAAPRLEHIDLRLPQLRKWLECPLQGGAALRLGLRAPADDEAARVEAEPFEIGGLDRRQLLREALWESLRGGASPEACYRSLRERQEALGRLPLGILGEEESLRHLELLRAWEGQLKGAELQVHRFGEAPEGELPPTHLHRALGLELPLAEGTVTVTLGGFTQPQWRGGSLLLSDRSDAKEPTDRERKDALKAYLDQVLLAAAGYQTGPHRAWICTALAPEAGMASIDFPALTQEEARALLQRWLAEALGESHPWALPLEALLEDAEDLGEWMQDRIENQRGFSSRYGPLRRPEDHLPPEGLDWKGLLRARLGGFLAALGSPGAAGEAP